MSEPFDLEAAMARRENANKPINIDTWRAWGSSTELLIKTVVRRALMKTYEESYAMVILQKLLQDVRTATKKED